MQQGTMPPYNMVFRSAQGLSEQFVRFHADGTIVHMIAKCLASGILHILLHVCLMNSDNQNPNSLSKKSQ